MKSNDCARPAEKERTCIVGERARAIAACLAFVLGSRRLHKQWIGPTKRGICTQRSIVHGGQAKVAGVRKDVRLRPTISNIG